MDTKPEVLDGETIFNRVVDGRYDFEVEKTTPKYVYLIVYTGRKERGEVIRVPKTYLARITK